MKKGKTVVAIIGLLLVLWCGILITAYVRCGSLKAPIFVIELEGAASDGGSRTCQGLGYQVKIKKHIDVEYGVCIDSVEMWMFGRVISASVT